MAHKWQGSYNLCSRVNTPNNRSGKGWQVVIIEYSVVFKPYSAVISVSSGFNRTEVWLVCGWRVQYDMDYNQCLITNNNVKYETTTLACDLRKCRHFVIPALIWQPFSRNGSWNFQDEILKIPRWDPGILACQISLRDILLFTAQLGKVSKT